MKPNYPYMASMAFNTPLYVTPSVINSVRSVLQPRMEVNVINAISDTAQMGHEIETFEPTKTTRLAVTSGVSVIKVHGILVARMGLIDGQCAEILSYEKLRNQVQAALDSEEVEKIVLDGNSGGGMATGCYEFAEFIYNNRHVKPIIFIVNFYAYSACYFIAAACSEIYISTTGGVGSIGVRLEHAEYSKMADEMGVTFNTFTRGDRKNDLSMHHEMSDETRAVVDAEMDDSYDLFVQSVAKYRGLTPEAVIATQAGTFTGEKAIAAGLADHLSTPTDAINAIAKSIPAKTNNDSIVMQAQAMNMIIQAQPLTA